MTLVNDITKAIGKAINTEFNADTDQFEIYSEEISQELNEPCFFIQCLESGHNQFLGERYERTNSYMIQYFPESEQYESECAEIAERLYWCLEYITVAGDTLPIRGTNMHAEVQDNVLNFTVSYNGFVRKITDKTVMETLTSDVEMKEGS